jgi:hypothetical protein
MAENKHEGPEGVTKKLIGAVPGDDDVEGHKANNNKWGGGPEGQLHKKAIGNLPDSDEDDVEGHSAAKHKL